MTRALRSAGAHRFPVERPGYIVITRNYLREHCDMALRRKQLLLLNWHESPDTASAVALGMSVEWFVQPGIARSVPGVTHFGISEIQVTIFLPNKQRAERFLDYLQAAVIRSSGDLGKADDVDHVRRLKVLKAQHIQ